MTTCDKTSKSSDKEAELLIYFFEKAKSKANIKFNLSNIELSFIDVQNIFFGTINDNKNLRFDGGKFLDSQNIDKAVVVSKKQTAPIRQAVKAAWGTSMRSTIRDTIFKFTDNDDKEIHDQIIYHINSYSPKNTKINIFSGDGTCNGNTPYSIFNAVLESLKQGFNVKVFAFKLMCSRNYIELTKIYTKFELIYIDSSEYKSFFFKKKPIFKVHNNARGRIRSPVRHDRYRRRSSDRHDRFRSRSPDRHDRFRSRSPVRHDARRKDRYNGNKKSIFKRLG